MSAAPRVFSIPAGARFLPTFVTALLGGEIVPEVSLANGPFALADATIYVPTRRAARALLAAFAYCAGGGAAVLPKIRPLGAVDEDAELFAAPAADVFALDPDIPDAIGDIQRRFILAELVLGWSRALKGAIVRVGADGALATDSGSPIAVGSTPADAVALAGDLAALIDEFIIEGAPWSAVRNLVAEDYDEYWGITTRFLKIAVENWPEILKARGLVDPAQRRAMLIEREISRMSSTGRNEATIVLGSTGTNNATARLMRAIARAPRGAVVLPGLDADMRAIDWDIVAGGKGVEAAHGHPQAALARLVRALDCSRGDVRPLGRRPRALENRMAFVSQALAPEESTANWRPWREGREEAIAEALAGVTLIEAADENTEALAIAVRLREILETPGRTAAVITPDRAIARRVQAELRRWDIDIDDSGGEPLGQTTAGVFARAALRAAEEESDVALVALLARGPVAPMHDRARTKDLARMLEIGVLRVALHDPDMARRIAWAHENAHSDFRAHPAARRIGADDWRDVAQLAEGVALALAPLRAEAGAAGLGTWAGAHRECLRLLALHADPADGDDSAALDQLFDELTAIDSDGARKFELTLDQYARLFDTLASAIVVRGPQRVHARLKILGPLEARLLDVDVAILAGLDENVWPPQPKSDPFLNRPMRAQIGLTPPERRIGQTAHDFWMAIGAPEVVITRARKRGGTPTVASRFLQRMAALADDRFEETRARGARWLALAAMLDKADKAAPLARPAPKPPLEMRPTALSVTRIETLRRDPYAIYAERILKLKAVGPLDGEHDLGEQGTAMHAALHELAKRWPSGDLPPDARDILIAAARSNLSEFFADPTWEAFVWPRLVSGIDYVLDYERERRPNIATVHGEVSGVFLVPLADGSEFRLTAVADRIEIDRDGRVRIVDYKTGAAPTLRQAEAGFATQVTLEAKMAALGAFQTIGAREATSGLYLKLGGAGGGKRVSIAPKDRSFADLAEEHWSEMCAMLASWRDANVGYASRPYVQYALKYSDCDHLARVKEWSAAGDAGGGDE
jgi:ATP-dependent helicase/nuclease subunit B